MVSSLPRLKKLNFATAHHIWECERRRTEFDIFVLNRSIIATTDRARNALGAEKCCEEFSRGEHLAYFRLLGPVTEEDILRFVKELVAAHQCYEPLLPT